MRPVKIPSQFRLIDRTITVVELDEMVGDSNSADGYCHLGRGILAIRADLPRQQLEHTYFHELAHLLFEAAGRPDLSEDENLMDLFGALLRQWYITSQGEAPF